MTGGTNASVYPFGHPELISINAAIVNAAIALFTVGSTARMLLSFLLIWQFWKGNPTFSSAFYKLYVIQGVPDWFLAWSRVVKKFVAIQNPTYRFVEQILWLSWDQTTGLLDTLLMLNRFTALVCWPYHRRLWTGSYFIAIVLLMELYPFLVVSHLFPDFYCIFTNSPTCKSTYDQRATATFISNVVNAILPLILGVVVFVARRRCLRHETRSRQQVQRELRLFYICVVCDFWLLLNVSVQYVMQRATTEPLRNVADVVRYMVLYAVNSVLWILYSYSFFILSFCVNARVRRELLPREPFFRLKQVLVFASSSLWSDGSRSVARVAPSPTPKRSTPPTILVPL